MTSSISQQSYLELSEKVLNHQVTVGELSSYAQTLPALTVALVTALGKVIEGCAPADPQRAHAIALVADQTAVAQKADLFTRSLAAWFLGFALNQLGYPKQVDEVVQRARQGFEELGDAGWIAACDWQQFSLSWTKPNLVAAESALSSALTRLQEANFIDFLPHCRLALAYAQILLTQFNQARRNISACENHFMEVKDLLNQARCWLHEASSLRREGRLDDAIVFLERAQQVFSDQGARSDFAKAEMQLGLSMLIKSEDLSEAGRRLMKAAQLFGDLEMDLWQATCLTNLGYVHLLTGFLEESHTCFQQAGKNFSNHQVLGLIADNLNDSGKLNLLRGFPTQSIEQFKRAQQVHQEIGAQLPAAIEGGNLGEAYGFAGRYQDALHHLELAAETFASLQNTVRRGAVEQSIALIWKQLNQPALALDHIDRATRYLEMANQKAMIASAYHYRASILFAMEEKQAAIDCLRMSLELSIQHGMKPLAARAHRLLGEALLNTDQDRTEALNHLYIAQQVFQDMGMILDLAETLVVLGRYYLQASDFPQAGRVFKEALDLSEDTFNEVDWRAHEGLASLASLEGDNKKILFHYQQGMTSLAKIRDNFWQPALAGSYLQTPAAFVERAIHHALQSQAPEQALRFMEENKATTLVSQLLNKKLSILDEETLELTKIKADINWLQEKMRESSNSASLIKNAIQSRNYRKQLIQKAREYDILVAALERKERSNSAPSLFRKFDQSVFRANANAILGRNWLALDYHVTDDRLTILMLTPDDCQAYSVFISDRFHAILELLSKSRQTPVPSEGDLCFLGGLLIPSSVADILSPDTYLILSPHKKLHGIPWSAMQPGFTAQALVKICTPFVVPSLHSLTLLWEQDGQGLKTDNGNGLLIGISDFQGIQIKLPHVPKEIAALSLHVGAGGRVLQESEATWEGIMKLTSEKANQPGLSRFDWMHVASHFSVDNHTGRLSGLSLYDGEIWLDQLRDLAPLPSLVTLSACNSVYSFLHEGDEHVGLPATCFISGARSLVGSLWPILDQTAANFMTVFYQHYFDSQSPARATARAQRQLLAQRLPMDHWAGFVCQGVP